MRLPILAICAVFSLSAPLAWAQEPVQAPEKIENPLTPSSQQGIRAISVRQLSAIEFGVFAPGRGGGMVTVDPSGKTRRAAGNIALMGGSQYGPAEFEIIGQPGEPIIIDLPPEVMLTTGVPITNLTAYPSREITLNETGRQRLSVGGTLQVSGTPTPGTFQGFFDINVRYLRQP